MSELSDRRRVFSPIIYTDRVNIECIQAEVHRPTLSANLFVDPSQCRACVLGSSIEIDWLWIGDNVVIDSIADFYIRSG